jgi:dihydrofolate reductase
MLISMIVAMSEAAHVIGLDGGMPWKLRNDLQRFKRITVGHPVIMGRKTHLSIGRPLPDRLNIVLSRDPAFEAPGCVVHRDLASALADVERRVVHEEVFLIGGAEVYNDGLALANRLYVTFVDYHGPADTFFPEDPWRRFQPLHPDPKLEVHDVDDKNSHPTRYMVMSRRTGAA